MSLLVDKNMVKISVKRTSFRTARTEYKNMKRVNEFTFKGVLLKKILMQQNFSNIDGVDLRDYTENGSTHSIYSQEVDIRKNNGNYSGNKRPIFSMRAHFSRTYEKKNKRSG